MNVSRQERLYSDILADEVKRMRITKPTENNKENVREKCRKERGETRITHKEERRRTHIEEEEKEWLWKCREWSPSQEWPITATLFTDV